MFTTVELLKYFSTQLITCTSPELVLQHFTDVIIQLFEPQQLILVTCDSAQQQVKVNRVHGLHQTQLQLPAVEWTRNVNTELFQRGEILALTEEGGDQFLIMVDPNQKPVFDCEMRIPIFIQKKLIGVVSLGPKAYGMEYTQEDLDLLQIYLNMVTICLERFNTSPAIPTVHVFEPCTPKDISREPELNRMPVKMKLMHCPDEMRGNSPSVRTIEELIHYVAPQDVTVLITGESGTGKELVARKIHQLSRRNRLPLVTMNCAALPESLVESELFGHEKGAFTNAFALKKGRFEIADGSTLFLDEIGDMSLGTQAKLLRVLQDGTFQRVGGSRTFQSDVRIIAATNKSLIEEIQKEHFRNDLYYRLNVVQIQVPPLRDRKEDIPVLADYFIQKFNEVYNKNVKGISACGLQKLWQYSFPGNIRELRNILERAVIMEKTDWLGLDFLPQLSLEQVKKTATPTGSGFTLESLEKKYIEQVLLSVNFNKSHASKILGIARKTLREKMQKYQIQ
ncbi:sigma-54 dependent transcriptional regulator [candidate division KSB1 bacterium]|nr:sigma-54 dependent transcriptional regulator [candidate division KSB1 bacterium]